MIATLLLAQSSSWIPVVALVVEIILALGAGIWFVAAMRTSIVALNQTVTHLDGNVLELSHVVERLTERTGDHEARLQVIEAYGKPR